ncbi:MAG: type II toxin-antitoxin system RelE/ParE family toxin [Nitrosomonas sp.]|nr:type II toxin-antitoxin system RelE/ParE family toxin [Nitrosomonas sp.]
MEVIFEDDSLRKLEEDPAYDAEFDRSIVKSYRMRIQFIRAAEDERVFYNMKSLHYEKLKGNFDGFHSMRLNKQWRLVFKYKKGESGKVVVVVSIIDYH